jgi:hypothetical protein
VPLHVPAVSDTSRSLQTQQKKAPLTSLHGSPGLPGNFDLLTLKDTILPQWPRENNSTYFQQVVPCTCTCKGLQARWASLLLLELGASEETARLAMATSHYAQFSIGSVILVFYHKHPLSLLLLGLLQR